MKRTISILAALISGVITLGAQERAAATDVTYEVVDSLVYIPTAAVDSSLAGRSIFEVLPHKTSAKAGVTVHQSQAVKDGMASHIAYNRTRSINGYRVRIFFDNKQSSRTESENAVRRFRAGFPGVAAYRSFVTPFFKVTVGDFRTRNEALQFLQQVQGEFPTAFVVKEKINYPVVDREHSYIVDTLHVTRPVFL